MKKNVQIIIGAIIVFAACFFYSYIDKTHCIYNEDIDTSDYLSTAAWLNETVCQNFISHENSLDGIKVKVRLTGETDTIECSYQLLDVQENRVVAENVVTGENFKDSKFYVFRFDTIEECKGKEYQFIIENMNETSGNSIDFCFEPNIEKDTKMQINGDEYIGTTILKTVTHRFDVETFCVLMLFVLYIVLFLKFLYKLFK